MFRWTLKQAGIQLELQVETADVYVHTEGIQQVISNLLDNAIQYYKGKGPIRITGQKQNNGYYIGVSGPSEPIPDR